MSEKKSNLNEQSETNATWGALVFAVFAPLNPQDARFHGEYVNEDYISENVYGMTEKKVKM